MLASIWRRARDDEDGFTLPELLVAIIIAAILIAAAVVIFTQFIGSSQDARAKASLDSARVDASSYYQQHQNSYVGYTNAVLCADLPSLHCVAPATAETWSPVNAASDPLGVYVASDGSATAATQNQLVLCTSPQGGNSVYCEWSNGNSWFFTEGINKAVTISQLAGGTAGDGKNSYGGASNGPTGAGAYWSDQGF